mgnify:CR=1 FL=1
MKEKMLRRLSGIDNLLRIAKGRFIIGIIFIIYGVIILLADSINDFWIKISIAVAFFGLGLTFVLDGQSILREYFRDKPKK